MFDEHHMWKLGRFLHLLVIGICYCTTTTSAQAGDATPFEVETSDGSAIAPRTSLEQDARDDVFPPAVPSTE